MERRAPQKRLKPSFLSRFFPDVAVTGLPEPRVDHAIVMARFARDILSRMTVQTKELEVVLGPDTADLKLRIGVHSGPVTVSGHLDLVLILCFLINALCSIVVGWSLAW